MKYLMITGASRSVIWFRKELIKFLIEKGHKIFVISCDNDYSTEIEKLGVEFYCIEGDNRDTNPLSNLNYINKISKLIKKISPDKILTFQAKANTFGVIGARKAKCSDIHSMVEGLGMVFTGEGIKYKILAFISKFLYRISFKKVKTVFVLNESDLNFIIRNKLAKRNQCCLINGIGVDIEKFNEQPLPDLGTIKFVMVARVEKDKGVIEYCEAAKSLIDSGINNVEFNYYGANDYKTNIISAYSDSGYVSYHGYTDNIIDIYRNNHVIVLPSYHEGVPRSLLEGCACGRAIIASDIAGCRVCVEENKNGFIVKIKDVNDLKSKIMTFIENKQLISDMGDTSRKIAVEKFDSNIINQKIYERIYG